MLDPPICPHPGWTLWQELTTSKLLLSLRLRAQGLTPLPAPKAGEPLVLRTPPPAGEPPPRLRTTQDWYSPSGEPSRAGDT